MTNASCSQHCAKKFTNVIYVKMILLAGVATLGTRGFFLARDGELRFVSRRPKRVWPKAQDTSGEAARKNRFSRGSL